MSPLNQFYCLPIRISFFYVVDKVMFMFSNLYSAFGLFAGSGRGKKQFASERAFIAGGVSV